MVQAQWTAVDNYITDLFVPPDFAPEAALQSTHDANLLRINVASNQGKLLHILALSHNATRISGGHGSPVTRLTDSALPQS